jgi:ribosomal protein S16
MQRFFTVYKILNKRNSEYYIGVHITENAQDDYLGSGTRIRKSIEKYGRESFEKIILFSFDNPEDMLRKEKELVNEETLKDPLCLNIALGGQGGWYSVLTPDLRKKVYSSELQSARSWYNNPEWRRINSDRIYEWQTRGAEKGRKKIEEMRKEGWVSPGFKGKTHTEEHREKMSKIMKNAQSGDKNSQYGTCWIHSLLEKRSIRIKKDELQDWLQNGWILGRKMKFSE